MSTVVKVKLSRKIDDSYAIVIGSGLSKSLGKQIVRDGFGGKYCIITDSNTQKIFGKKLLSQLRSAGAHAQMIVFSGGEENKNISSVEKILEQMLAKGFGRRDCIVALGGGIVGDVAGFAASVYLRGINFVQVPTTLLAMVDSSIGGKTGVNLSEGKNSAGAFYQPKKVYICPELLKTLPENEMRNGMSEIVKHAIMFDAKFFAYLEKNLGKIMKLDSKTLEYVIKRNCELKAKVVEKDELESNFRRVVNYGHTIGHALEVLTGYKGMSHGEAISIGMVSEAVIAYEMGLMKAHDIYKIANLLHKIGLPIDLPNIEMESILSATRKDKKAVSGKAYYSLPAGIGKATRSKGQYGIEVSDEMVRNSLGCCDDNCSCCCENC